jgi:hypothetical protein
MDRRSVLNAGLNSIVTSGAVVVSGSGRPAAPSPDIDIRAWDAAMARYNSAKHAMDSQEGDEVVGHFIKAEAAILDTRTPDIKALHWKLERMRDISEHCVIAPKDFEKLVADVVCLLGGA